MRSAIPGLLRGAALALLLLAGLGLWSQRSAAHSGHANQAIHGGRYQLSKLWLGQEVQVFDREQARLYVLSLSKGEAYCMQPLKGTAVTRALKRVETKPIALAEKPAWPVRAAKSTGANRFAGLGEQVQGKTFEGGSQPAFFDGDTGRIYVIESPRLFVILDPVAGKVTRQHFVVKDGAGLLARVQRRHNEQRAVAGLRAIALAQKLFKARDADKDGKADYGTLAELGKAKLIGAALASGERDGYRFQVRPSPLNPEALWMAVAAPLEPGKSGRRHFAINDQGVVRYGAKAIKLNDECRIPSRTRKLK